VTQHEAVLEAVEDVARIANLGPLHSTALGPPVSTVVVPILVFAIPVLAIVFLVVSGRGLSGSCDAMKPDGSCNRCGRPAVEIDATQRRVPETGPGAAPGQR
jgi:hypothetical protein